MSAKHHYLIHIQFLGFRYHGWAKQTGLRTVHEMVDKTTSFVLGHDGFRTLGCSRTDAKVSAFHYAFELVVGEQLDIEQILDAYNSNFPPDIKALRIEEIWHLGLDQDHIGWKPYYLAEDR